MPGKWEIWWADVKFDDDLTQIKRRPMLIIDKSNCFLISLKITSHEPREKFYGEYNLIKWSEAGLSEESTVRCSKRINLLSTDLVSKIGKLRPIDISNIQVLLSTILY